MDPITSVQNPKIKHVRLLRKARERSKEELFIIEGYRENLRFSEKSFPVKSLYYCPEMFLGSNEQALIDRMEELGAELILCSPYAFEKISYRDRPDGLLAIAPYLPCDLSLLTVKENSLFVIAEGMEKPGNLGTILRSSDAVGASGVIVSDKRTDIHNPNVVRASVGTLFTVPIAETSNELAYAWAIENGLNIVAASPEEGSLLYTKVDFKGPTVIVLGTEQLGLSKFWMEKSHQRAKLPMCGFADSLNVAMAATAFLYESLRQRT